MCDFIAPLLRAIFGANKLTFFEIYHSFKLCLRRSTCSDLIHNVVPYLSASGEVAETVTDGYKKIVNALFHDAIIAIGGELYVQRRDVRIKIEAEARSGTHFENCVSPPKKPRNDAGQDVTDIGGAFTITTLLPTPPFLTQIWLAQVKVCVDDNKARRKIFERAI